MKSLPSFLASAVMSMGLAACVSDAPLTSPSKPKPSAPIVEVPSSVDYNTVAWDRAYIEAIGYPGDEEINLFGLQFESYVAGEPGIRVVRQLSPDEVQGLQIHTRQTLSDYLKGRCKESSGYIGPKILL